MIIFLSFETESDRFKFDYIYEHYKRLLLHKAYGILKDYTLAEDATSEAFIRIYKNLHKVEDTTSRKTISFLVTIVRNVALTMLQKEKQHPINAAEDMDIEDDFDLESLCITNEMSQNILKIVDDLKEELKAPFLLKYAHDLSHKQISEILEISENNVTVRIHRAKKKIMELIQQEGYLYDY